jgi:hypothetical protein
MIVAVVGAFAPWYQVMGVSGNGVSDSGVSDGGVSLRAADAWRASVRRAGCLVLFYLKRSLGLAAYATTTDRV